MGSGGPRRIRTPDPLIRSQVLYPAELSVRLAGMYRCECMIARDKIGLLPPLKILPSRIFQTVHVEGSGNQTFGIFGFGCIEDLFACACLDDVALAHY